MVALRRNVPIVFVDKRVDPPLRFVRFSREVFVSHLYQGAPLLLLLPQGRCEVVEIVPGASDLLSRTEKAHPLL